MTQDTHNMSPRHDISRILDPSYSSSSSQPSSSSSAYVDTHGDLHDPDFHIFPIAQPNHRRHSPHYHMAPRPAWELIDEDALEEEQDDELEGRLYGNLTSRRPTYQQQQRRRSSGNSYSLRTSASSYSYNKRQQTSPHHIPHYTPHSFDSEDTVLDESDDDDDFSSFTHRDKNVSGVSRFILRTKGEFTRRRRSIESAGASPDSLTQDSSPISDVDADIDVSQTTHNQPAHYPFTRTFSLQSQGRRSRASQHRDERTALTASPHSQQEQQRSSFVEEDEEEVPETRWTPTCTQVLRMQWQSVALRVRFSLFRTQKKLSTRWRLSRVVPC